jgi:hypothetical protein
MEVPMNEEEKRLLENFRRLSPSNKHIALAQIIAGAEFEANVRRQYGLQPGSVPAIKDKTPAATVGA